jgi:hypothetical protein
VDCVRLVETSDRLGDSVIKLRIPLMAGNFWLVEDLLTFQEELCSVELAGG